MAELTDLASCCGVALVVVADDRPDKRKSQKDENRPGENRVSTRAPQFLIRRCQFRLSCLPLECQIKNFANLSKMHPPHGRLRSLVRVGPEEKAISVPAAAVLRDTENKPFVYVATGQSQFGRRLVTIGDSQDGKTQILSGLAAGERVVGDGSLFLQFANSLQH